MGLLGVGEMGQALARVFAGQLIKNVVLFTSLIQYRRFVNVALLQA